MLPWLVQVAMYPRSAMIGVHGEVHSEVHSEVHGEVHGEVHRKLHLEDE